MAPQSFFFPPPPPPPPLATFTPPPSASSSSRGRGSRARGAYAPRGNNNYREARYVSNPGHSNSVSSNLQSHIQSPGRRGSQPQFHRTHDPRDGSLSHGSGQKRLHHEAFPKRSQQSHVAPSVPSFGASLPMFDRKPGPAVHANDKKLRKDIEQRHNTLGLTPQTRDISSDEEDDEGEEVRLAAHAASSVDKVVERLVLIYKGKTYRLNSPAAIAEWVTERRKNFPTNEQFTETRQRLQLAKAKEKLERARTTIKKGKVHLPSAPKILLKAAETPTQNGSEQAAISKQKIEKLRRKLEEEERKLALAEGERRSDEHENLPETKPNTGHIELPCANGTSSKQGPTPVAHSLKQEHDVDEGHAKPISDQSQSIKPGMKRVDSTSSLDSCNIDASSAVSSGGSEDLTSSSGSSASDEDSGSDSAPEEQTSRIEAPTRVPPPARKGPKHICFQFQKSGTCAKGNSCPYQHTKDVNRTKKEKAQGRQAVPYKGRISLFQRLVQQEQRIEAKESTANLEQTRGQAMA